MKHADVVIVGAGHGGAQEAIALRQNGFEGSILVIGREPHHPYERPPLSKEYLSRDKEFDRLYLRPPAFWVERNVEMLLSREVTAVDPAAHAVTLGDGTQIGYGKLIWATGGEPRKLSCGGADLAGVHSVRTRDDVDRMMAELDCGARQVVVIGGGYIGLEAAAVLIKLGCKVTLLEALPRVLARVAGEELSAFFEAEHRRQGVEIRTGVTVDCLEGADGKVTGVKMADGEILPAEMVIVGIGIIPSVGPLIEAGASGSNGVDVDELCRTSLPDIYAIGDCAAHASVHAEGAVIRLESVQNANDMASTVAKDVIGDALPYRAFPWFWSNQYDLRLQTAGLSIGYDKAVLRGDPDARAFSVVYFKGGRIIAIDCVNAVKDYVQGRKLIEAGATPDPAQVADASVPLKSLA